MSVATSIAVLYPSFPLRSVLAVPKGFNELRDTQDGYSFVYPFGWQVWQRQQPGQPEGGGNRGGSGETYVPPQQT